MWSLELVIKEAETINVISATPPHVGLASGESGKEKGGEKRRASGTILDDLVYESVDDIVIDCFGTEGLGTMLTGRSILRCSRAAAHALGGRKLVSSRNEDALLITVHQWGLRPRLIRLHVGAQRSPSASGVMPLDSDDGAQRQSKRKQIRFRDVAYIVAGEEDDCTNRKRTKSRRESQTICTIKLRGEDEANRSAVEERYKEAKREAKKAVARAKEKAYEDLYKRLDSKEGENDIYRIAKARHRRKMDLGSVRFIKDEDGRSIIKEDAIRRRLEEYFFALFNKVKEALRKMGRNKAVGPHEITIEAWRCLGGEGVRWLTILFNKTFLRAKMPEEWRLSEVIPIYKNKGDTQTCSNYMGIKLLSHTMKLWERVIERRLRRETENQFGFMPGRSTMEAIRIISSVVNIARRSLMEKYRERQKDLAFLDLEKAYDNVPRGELMWKTLSDKGTPMRYIKVIQDMYEGARTCVRTPTGNTKYFPVDVDLHQGLAISPYLNPEEGLNGRLEQWRKALEDNGLRVSREKTEYLRCNFSRNENDRNEEEEIRIGEHIIPWICDTQIREDRGGDSTGYVVRVNKMREGRLRWFGHVKRRPQYRRVEPLTVNGARRRGRPKLRWEDRREDRLKTDLKELLLSEDMTSDRSEWRTRIRVDEGG
ncbi:retrovirus-related pol polyprotein LINE-1 [Tanacetum coccineum]